MWRAMDYAACSSEYRPRLRRFWISRFVGTRFTSSSKENSPPVRRMIWRAVEVLIDVPSPSAGKYRPYEPCEMPSTSQATATVYPFAVRQFLIRSLIDNFMVSEITELWDWCKLIPEISAATAHG